MNVNQTVLDAIELLANSKVEKANYNTTIQAQIISCEDASIGKYRCRYQDAIIYAYSNNIDTTYTNGSYVNILVPGNDMSKDKTILGSTTRSGVSYISQLDNQAVYDINGTNCINVNDIDKFYLNTLNRDYKYTIYQYGESSDISLDDLALAYYIRRSSSIKVAATFKTSIAPERQTRGHYGITYNLRFLDNTSNQEVIRSYTINEDNMKDNPYRLAYGTEQSQYFKIDGQNFIRIESIEIFNKGFPGANGVITDRRLETGDIEITDLKFFGTSKLSESELNGLSVSLSVPQGLIFKDDSTTADYKMITAKVRIKGKEVAIDKNFSFYWGRENNQVMANNRYYNKHLGRGWECLNQSNVIDADPTVPNDPNAIIEWVPAGDTYKMSFTAATASDNKIKVVVVYNGNTASKQVNIKNLCAETPQLTIESSNGTKFYYDIGHPTLTCKVNGTQPQNYHYYWAYVSDNQVLEELPETTSENTAYTAAVAALTNLQNAIASGVKFENAQKENLTTLQNNVKAFNSIQRVEGNKIYNVQINDITDSRTFKCTVFNENGILLGTPSITLENTLSGEDLYSLVINNGTQVFQYNENGVAPNSKSLDSPQEILPLSFAIYDNLGQPIQEDILENINNCRIKWEFPKTNTMLVDSQENGLDFDEDENYRYYNDKPTLFYNISQRYYIQKQRNQIKLTVRYKGLSLSAETNFTFAKQGEPGTNGTEYIVKLVPNTTMSTPPLAPMITNIRNRYFLNYGLENSMEETEIYTNKGYKFFKAQLWHSGELVWEGNSVADIAQDNILQPSKVTWSILSNKYNSEYSDESAFEILNEDKGTLRYTGDHLNPTLNEFRTPLANIIKCSIDWEGKTYYGTIPVITAWVSNENYIDYRIKLKDYTGFRYVMYSSDGITPQYDDSTPFEFICEEKINNIWEDVSLVSGTHEISYIPYVVGNYLSKDGAAIDSSLLEILSTTEYEKNQFVIRPKSRYNGLCVNNAVCCIYINRGHTIGIINVPIHFLLNKYGLSHINAWDGNSIQVDDEGGFILSPQVGAGRKEQDNSFTGVLMGQVRSPDKNEPQSGLFGYNSGARTFFLNSQNGSAILGKADNGQIIIDPTAQKAMIYSHNFWKSTNYGQDGLPIDYTSIGQAGAGLLIDLTTPEIRFGNGNFMVSSNGILRAKGANIEGDITATSLQLRGNAKVPSEKVDGLQDALDDLQDELQSQIDGKIETWAQDTNPATSWTTSKERDRHNGDLWYYSGSTDLVLSPTLTIEPLKTYQYDSSNNTWTAYSTSSSTLFDLVDGKTTIYYNTTDQNFVPQDVQNGDYLVATSTGNTYKWNENDSRWEKVTDYNTAISNALTFYIREDGVIGEQLPVWESNKTYAIDSYVQCEGATYKCVTAHISSDSNKPSNANNEYWTAATPNTFVVSTDGLLTASNAIIYGTIYAYAGKIGGLELLNNTLSKGSIGTNNSVFLSTQNLSATIAGESRTDLRFTIGSSFGVTENGGLFANSGKIGPFSLSTDGLALGSFIQLSPSRLYVSNTPTAYQNAFYAVTDNGAYIGLRNSTTGQNAQAAYFGYIPSTLEYEQVAPPSDGWGIIFSHSGNILVNSGNLNFITNNGGLVFSGMLNKNNANTVYRIQLSQSNNFSVRIPTNGQINFPSSTLRVHSDGRMTLSSIGASVMLPAQQNGFLPQYDETTALGGEHYKWTVVYAKNNVINTSDRKQKDILGKIDFAENFIMSLQPITFMWKNGDHRRTRMGLIAQDVAKVCKDLNQNLSIVTASYKEENLDGEFKPYYGEQVDDNLLTWGLSYEQLIAPIIAVLQKQQKRIKELEDIVYEN